MQIKIFSELESNRGGLRVGQRVLHYLVSLVGKVVRSYPDLTRKNYLVMQLIGKKLKRITVRPRAKTNQESF